MDVNGPGESANWNGSIDGARIYISQCKWKNGWEENNVLYNENGKIDSKQTMKYAMELEK